MALYESNYPVVLNEEPDWQALPTAYFQFDPRQMTQHEHKPLHGTFLYAHGNRPRIGEFLLAAFSYKQERYLYNASLDYVDTYEICLSSPQATVESETRFIGAHQAVVRSFA